MLGLRSFEILHYSLSKEGEAVWQDFELLLYPPKMDNKTNQFGLSYE